MVSTLSSTPTTHHMYIVHLWRSSVELRVLCQGGGVWGGLSSSLIGQKCKMVDGKQPSDWTIIQDGNSACDWTRIQDGEWKSSHLIGQ